MATTSLHGATNFCIDVPYVLVQPDDFDASREYPMVMALHGMGQAPRQLRRALEGVDLPGCLWLFPCGPYPVEVRRPDRMRIGHAWYMYDGNQQSLRASMEKSIEHLTRLHDHLRAEYRIGATALVGFSQGGYLAGFMGPRDPDRFVAAACIGGRIKHEFLAELPEGSRRVALAQFHGARDTGVDPAAARAAAEAARDLGFTDVHYHEDPDAGHEISPQMAKLLQQWLRRVL